MGKSENTENAREHWKQKLNDALSQPEEPVLAIAIRRGWNSAARPVLVRGIDKKEYVIKGQQAGRQIINDQVVARLGVAMDAPVGEPAIMEISSDLIEADPNFDYLTVGTAHGTVFIGDCSDDREPVNYIHQSENRARFALLCVLYGWIYSNDCQFIYKKSRPNLVYSVDHGHFFPGGPNWTECDLIQAPQAELDPFLDKHCNFTTDEISSALRALESVSEETIIQAVATPPSEWGLTLDERVTLVEYLTRQQQQLLTFL
ncbi:HipA family kinase [Phormidium nigroviride]